MTQLHCYVPEDIAQQAQRRAEQSGLSLSRYLAELVKRDTGISASWPEGYFDLFGKWEGERSGASSAVGVGKTTGILNDLSARHQRLHSYELTNSKLRV